MTLLNYMAGMILAYILLIVITVLSLIVLFINVTIEIIIVAPLKYFETKLFIIHRKIIDFGSKARKLVKEKRNG